MKTLEYKLGLDGSDITFKVLSQPTEWWSRFVPDKSLSWYCDETGITVASSGHPELNPDYIYLRGLSVDSDDDTATLYEDDDDDARRRFDIFATTLKLFNKYLEEVLVDPISSFLIKEV